MNLKYAMYLGYTVKSYFPVFLILVIPILVTVTHRIASDLDPDA